MSGVCVVWCVSCVMCRVCVVGYVCVRRDTGERDCVCVSLCVCVCMECLSVGVCTYDSCMIECFSDSVR